MYNVTIMFLFTACSRYFNHIMLVLVHHSMLLLNSKYPDLNLLTSYFTLFTLPTSITARSPHQRVTVYVVMWCSTAMRGCQEVGGRMDTGA